jgi:NAD(P)-dependent dehydrogenase (short-subunit alcohol dehydrogenase family)
MFQKIALVTGANRGIGLETARQLCLAGVHTYLGVRSLEQGQQALDKLAADGVKASILELDVTDSASYAAVYGYLNSRYGKLDILVNNAGIAAGPFPGAGPEHNAADVPMDLLRRVFETNFFSLVALTKTLLPLIRNSSAGRIVNLASILGSLQLQAKPGSPVYDSKSFAYDASKTAVNAYTIHLAYELRETKIKVNSAHPGWVKTDMGGPDAMMEIADGARTSVELALLGDDGPSGGFFHLGKPLPW